MEALYTKEIAIYCDTYTKPESSMLIALKEDTYKSAHGSVMLSEKITAKFLQFCIQMSQAKMVLDVGTYTGYSALAMAEVVGESGMVYTIDRTVQPSIKIAKEHFEKSGKMNRLKLILGDADEVIPKINEVFDLVFIDADKMSSQVYYELVVPKVKSGGVIIIDDCLWRKQVVQPEEDKRAHAMHRLNNRVLQDERVDNIILPIRHGINLIRVL